MCTVLADIHCNIHAVPQNDDIKLNHRSARVVMPDGAIRECRGGIDIDHLLGYFCIELPKYFSSMPLPVFTTKGVLGCREAWNGKFKNVMVAWWVPAVSPQQEWLCSSPWTHTRSVSWAWGIHERIPTGCDWWLPNYYTVFFRGGNFDSWMQSMLRASMIFINFRRRNYDKATLTQLSDLLFHVSDNTDLGEKMQEFLQVFTEKKIEILHSILRR